MTFEFSATALTYFLNAVFAVVLGGIFRAAWKCVDRGRQGNFVDYAPSLLTSLGLFGTFLGIFIGLWNFDPKNIDGSITQLLGGLQTAFFTSLLGMALAILFKWHQTSVLDCASTEDVHLKEGVTPEDIHAVLSRQHDLLEKITSSIGGDSDRSMVGQLQMLRSELSDLRVTSTRRQEAFEGRLWGQMDGFAEMLSRSATQQVIEALKQVIVEFNEKLTEQFGDNFKRLDQSVQKLVEWQCNYMQQLDAMSAHYALGVQAIDSTRVAVLEIGEKAAQIPVNMEALKQVMAVNQHQIQELNRHLEAFVQLRAQAVAAVPEIQQKLDEVGQQLLEGAAEVRSALIEGTDQSRESIARMTAGLRDDSHAVATQSEIISRELTDALELLQSNTERIRTGVTTAISQAMDGMEESTTRMTAGAALSIETMLNGVQGSVERANQSLVQNTEQSLKGVEVQVQDAVKRTNQAVNEQLRQLDEALERQLTAALRDLGSALATIATHLKKGYDDQRGTSQDSRRFQN